MASTFPYISKRFPQSGLARQLASTLKKKNKRTEQEQEWLDEYVSATDKSVNVLDGEFIELPSKNVPAPAEQLPLPPGNNEDYLLSTFVGTLYRTK